MANKFINLETNFGDIVIELFETESPITVSNFLKYVENDFYNNTIFHRVIPGFMIQGGGMDTESTEKSPILEPIKNEAAVNNLKNLRGTIAMARTSDPDSATCQFFINVVDNNFLNYTPDTYMGEGYAVFGKVVSGMEFVDQISKVETKNMSYHADFPTQPVIINQVKVLDSPPDSE